MIFLRQSHAISWRHRSFYIWTFVQSSDLLTHVSWSQLPVEPGFLPVDVFQHHSPQQSTKYEKIHKSSWNIGPRHLGDNEPLAEPLLTRLMSPYGITRPLRVQCFKTKFSLSPRTAQVSGNFHPYIIYYNFYLPRVKLNWSSPIFGRQGRLGDH